MELRKGPFHIAEFFYNKYLTYPILPYISKTKITPNIITTLNILLSFITFYLAYKKRFIIVAFMMLIYQFLDNLDGNLARYKDLKSDFGAVLDQVSDFIFYNFIFIFLGWGRINIILIILLVFLINFYGLYATKYIVPRLRKLKTIERIGLKKYLFNKGIILGIDVGTMDIISSVFLIFSKVQELYIFLIICFILDLVYRTLELKYNEKLQYSR